MLDAFASQASIAIQNAELYEEAVQTRHFFKNIMEGNAEAIITVEKGPGKIVHWNRAAERLYGYTEAEVIGKGVEIIIPQTSGPMNHRNEVFETNEPVLVETVRMKKDGTVFPVGITISPVRNGKGEVIAVVGIHRDLSEQKAREEDLRNESRKFQELSRTDSLTGLSNRRVLSERLIEEISRSKRHESPLSLLILDIDHFKKINDTYGHAAGDEVLSEVGNVIQEVSRDSDVPVRLGGEEFCVILPETDLAGAEILRTGCTARFLARNFSHRAAIALS